MSQEGDNMPILHWLDRDKTIKVANQVPFRLLEADDSLSYGEKNENMIIRGDNLEALKALLPYYKGQVKCIYIDPPYNTKSAFEHYDDNLEHSQWLHMMYPRMELLREFLREDGSIWVSIDDNEAHYLKVIMDEVFGRKNFLTSFIWKKSYGGGAKSRYVVNLHEHILCYAKSMDKLEEFFLPPDENVGKYYKYKDNKYELLGPYRLQPLATTSMDDRPNLRYPIIKEDGVEIWPTKQWQWSRERVEQAIKDGRIVISENKGKWTVSYKQYLRGADGEERKQKPKSIIEGIFTQHGSYESRALFGLSDKFSFPKPEALMQYILECCSSPKDIVMDSFLGSGTFIATAHKMKRRYIGIEMGEHAVTHVVPRMKKVVDGEQGGISKTVNWEGGGGFRFYKLGETVFDEEGRLNPAVKFPALAAHIWFTETKMPCNGEADSPLIGIHNSVAYYLLYNGILGDKRPDSGNVLTTKMLNILPPHDGPKVIYGEASRLGEGRLSQLDITFKQTPYDIKMR